MTQKAVRQRRLGRNAVNERGEGVMRRKGGREEEGGEERTLRTTIVTSLEVSYAAGRGGMGGR